MKVGLLTSSRADYSIYLPLLNALKKDSFFDLHLIVFGTHLSHKHGFTLQAIQADGFTISAQINSLPENDSPYEISNSMARTLSEFSTFWKDSDYELVFCFGDRFEMFAACSAAIPYGIKLAHIHGGETTLGAIDNVFRHCISQMCALHFVAAEPYKNRVLELLDTKYNVFNVGSLSFDNLKNSTLLSVEQFIEKFSVDLNIPTILITFHPETVNYKKNEGYMIELIGALEHLNDHQFLITMPNADTGSTVIREKWEEFIKAHPDKAFGFENLGTIGYYSAMKYASMMLGNTSSGCIEAAYFPTWVINIGDRQKGRLKTANRIDCNVNSAEIVSAISTIKTQKALVDSTVYGNGTAAETILGILKKYASEQASDK
ncbi:MAG: UDP-N-acetylglucosamine 2-epimerase (hydrolyzing) [Bacteroidetes bacterium]|nr:UDP-N-acetylglucosamine 2-epimerase (hydrolyzing) [Bacteroidota bacterium]